MIVPIPMISDKYGRKQVFVITIIVSIITQIDLVYVDSYNSALRLMFILGMTFPGRQIVGTFYQTELIPDKLRSSALLYMSLFGSLMAILMTVYYDLVSNCVTGLQVLFIVLGSLNLLCVILLVPESPKYLYSHKRFDEARDSLSRIAKFNG